MSDSTDIPEYMRAYAQELAAWREARKRHMPMPSVPKVTPDVIVMMPMRDGVKLFTEIVFPYDRKGRVPVILIRTPYPDSTFAFSSRPIDLFRSAGYAVVIQSCRGTWKSEGKFRFFQNEPEDGFDCIERLAEQDWSNGQVGMFGSSYLASVQWLAAGLKPPHLTCIAPQSPTGTFFYDTPFVGGVLFKNHILTWPQLVAKHSWDEIGFDLGSWLDGRLEKHSPLYEAMRRTPASAAVREFLADDSDMADAMCEALNHPTLDSWWDRIRLTPQSAGGIDIPIFAITGFYDGDQAGCLYNWEVVEANQASGASCRHLLVGAWRHSQMGRGNIAPMGEVRFGENAEMSLPRVILGFFDAYMKGDAAALDKLPKRCRLYTSGSNTWHEVSNYPPENSVDTRLYLSSSGEARSLFGDGVLRSEPVAGEAADTMPVDWEVQVPVVDIGDDARENEARSDVLVYTSLPLSDDWTVLGPVQAVLYVAVNAPDCDVVVRIDDVHPDGRALNMTGELGFGSFRARYRAGFDREVPLTPGQPAPLTFHVCHMGHVFKRGHRIRLAISGTVEHLLEPNPHTGEPIGTAVTRRKAIETIYHDGERPSHIVLPIYQAAQ